MTEHELTDEKVKELYADHQTAHHVPWRTVPDYRKESLIGIARAAYDLGKQASTDDGFIPCTFDEIRKGDTVERTWSYDGTVNTTVGVAADRPDGFLWKTKEGKNIAGPIYTGTYRRKPAEVTPPDPEKHPIILDEDGDAWSWIGSLYQLIGEMDGYRNPEVFGNDWTPAHVVAK